MSSMPFAIAALIGAQLLGEVLRELLHLPLPGPVIGMFMMAIALTVGGSRRIRPSTGTTPLVAAANGLIGHMGLLFVPAGVGVMGQISLIRKAWLPILAGLLVSTLLGLMVTALVMKHMSRVAGAGNDVLDGTE